MSGFGVWMRRGLFLAAFLGVLLPALSFAEDVQKMPEMQNEKDEYDFNWLDPDKKIYVVQNRKYTKAKKIELVAGGGIGIGEPYRKTTTFMPRLIAYFNEHWGIEGIAGFNSNSENDNFSNLKQVSSQVPTVRDVQQFFGGSVVWLPFYGKLNTFNQLFYFDWYLEAGLSNVKSEIDLNTSATGMPLIKEDTYTGIHWGTGMKFFVNRHVGVRLDYLSLYYKAPLALAGTVDEGVKDSFNNNYFTLGVSYTF